MLFKVRKKSNNFAFTFLICVVKVRNCLHFGITFEFNFTSILVEVFIVLCTVKMFPCALTIFLCLLLGMPNKSWCGPKLADV